MSKKGGCKQCTWLWKGKICLSPKAKRLERGRLMPCLNQKVKDTQSYYNPYLKRTETTIKWTGCYNGISDFKRKRDKK